MRKTFLFMLLSLLYVGGNLAWGQIAAGDYFIKNVESGKFLNGANSWGTKASVTKHGQKMTVAVSGDGYTIDSHISNGGDSHFVNQDADLYVDKTAVAHTITSLGDGVYTVQSSNGDYLVQEAGDLVNFKAVELTDAAKWYFLSMEDLFKTLDEATAENPVDATFFVGDPNFSRNNQYFSAWQGGPAKGGHEPNNCAEKYNCAFDVYQIVTGVPAGQYKLYCQGFYRYGNSANAATAATEGTEVLDAKLYANTSEASLQSIVNTTTLQAIIDNKINEQGGNWSDVTVSGNAYKMPNNMIAASLAFSAGLYGSELDVVVGETGEIRMGFKKETANVPDANWTIFDNFEIYYLGLDEAAIAAANTAIANLQAEAQALYEQPMEATVLEALKEAVANSTLPATPKPSEIASKNSLLSDAIADAKASILAYHNVGMAYNNASEAVSKYDEDAQASFEENAMVIMAGLMEGSIPTADCAAKIAEINALWAAACKASKSFQDGADVTPFIENNSFETGKLDPWTAAKGADTGVKPNSNATYTTEGVDGNYVFNTWNGSAMNFDVTQVVTGLASGIYEVKALYASDATNKANLNAGDETVEIAAEGKEVFVEGALGNILVATGELTVSMTSTGWFKADNFRLTYTRALTAEELEANRLANEEEIAAYNAAIEAVEGKLGFEAGEYAPYNNVEALTAFAAAKVDVAKTKAVDVVAATATIEAIELVANETFVAPVYNGDFALTENDGAPAGWISSNNTLGGAYHARVLVDDRLAVFNETKSAFYARFDGTNSDKGTLYKYGTTAGYTMPLKAGVDYTLNLDFGGWGQMQNTRFLLSDANGQAVASVDVTPTAKVSDEGNEAVDHVTFSFVPSVDGNCVLTIQNPGASANNAIAVSNIVIEKTSNETLAQRDYDWWEGLCGELTAAMLGNEEYILPDTRTAIQEFMKEDNYPSAMQAAREDADAAGTVYECPFDKELIESQVRGWIAEIEGIKNGTIALYTETGVVGDATLNSEMPFFATPVTTEVYVDKVVLKGWDGTEGSDLTIGYTKIAQNEEVTLSITGIEQTVNGEVVSEVKDEGETPYVVLQPQSGAYSMIGIDVLNEDGMTGIKLGEGGGQIFLYGQFFPIPNIGGEDDNMGVEEPIEAIYAVTWPGQEIINAVAWNRIKAQIANVEEAIANYDAIVSTLKYASRVEGEEFAAAVDAAREWVSTTTETYKAKYEAGTLTAEDGVKGDMMEQTMAVNDALNDAAKYDANRHAAAPSNYWLGNEEDGIASAQEAIEKLMPEVLSTAAQSRYEEKKVEIETALHALWAKLEAYTQYSESTHAEIVADAQDLLEMMTTLYVEVKNSVPAYPDWKWDFTVLTPATINALSADAEKTDAEGSEYIGWSNFEKSVKDGAQPTTENDYRGFYLASTTAGKFMAGEYEIPELAGLTYEAAGAKSIALAYNILSTASPAGNSAHAGFLWMMTRNKVLFSIKGVKEGTTISMMVESHKDGDKRGVELYTDKEMTNKIAIIEGSETPDENTLCTWEMPADGTVYVKANNGCHIYAINIDKELATSINNATVNVTSTGAVYNLAGQKVSSNYKGLVVKNGKAVIVK